jgi:hypothetical protein
MDRNQLDETARGFFKNSKDLKAIYATESGHFFYGRDSRQQFMVRSEKVEKPIDYFRDEMAKEQALKEALPEDCPGLAILLKNGFKSIAEVRACPDLSKIPNIGKKKADEITEFLKKFE